MVRHPAGKRVAVFHHVQTVHLRLRAVHFALSRETANRSNFAFDTQNIAIHRQNNVRTVQTRYRLKIRTESGGDSGVFQFMAIWFVGSPNGFWVFRENQMTQTLGGGRDRTVREESEIGSIPSGFQKGRKFGMEGCEVGLFPARKHRLRTLRIVKIEHRRLRPDVRSPFVYRVHRVTFDLGGTSIKGRHHKRHRPRAGRHGGCKEQRFTRNRPLDPFGEGD